MNVDQNDPKMDHILKQKSLRCLIRCINFNIDAVRVIRNCLLTMSKFQLPGKKSPEFGKKSENLNFRHEIFSRMMYHMNYHKSL